MQVPPPPQADGRKILLSPRVDKRVPPDDTSTSVSPLIRSFTGPEGNNLALTHRSIPTNKKIIVKKTAILVNTTVKSISII